MNKRGNEKMSKDMCQIVDCNFFQSEIISILYRCGRKDTLIDLIESEFLVVKKGGYKWNSDKKIWEFLPFYNLVEIAHQMVSQYRENYDFPQVSKEDVAKALNHVEKSDWDKKLNCKRHLFPLQGGKILNLETLELKDREKKDLFTFERPFSFLSNYNQVQMVMSCITYNTEYCRNVQSCFSYFLTGSTNNKCFYTITGDIMIRKFVFEMLKSMLGPFYLQVNNQKDLQHLRGKRLVFFSDLKLLNESMDLLYANSTCKYLIPFHRHHQFKQQVINIRFLDRAPKSFEQIISTLNVETFFHWCCVASSSWFKNRRSYK